MYGNVSILNPYYKVYPTAAVRCFGLGGLTLVGGGRGGVTPTPSAAAVGEPLGGVHPSQWRFKPRMTIILRAATARPNLLYNVMSNKCCQPGLEVRATKVTTITFKARLTRLIGHALYSKFGHALLHGGGGKLKGAVGGSPPRRRR